MKLLFLCGLSFCCLTLLAHEGHHEPHPLAELAVIQTSPVLQGKEQSWTAWWGSFHLVLLHFPIALINLVVVAEILRACLKKSLFDDAARFMLYAAAILAPITAVFGWIYSTSSTYSGMMQYMLRWHMWLGIATAVFTIALLYIRESQGRHKQYYAGLVFILILVNATAYVGGKMTFG